MAFKEWSQARAAAGDAKPVDKTVPAPAEVKPAPRTDRPPEQPMGIPPARKP